MKRLIVPLNSQKKSDVNTQLVGGKGANLIKLNQFGFLIPPGFVITTDAFRQIIRKSAGKKDAILGNPDLTSEKFSEILLSSFNLDHKLTKKIEKNRKNLKGPLAVRSSMVGEDQFNASFAGQLDTFLNVKAENLLSAIRKCFGSLYNPKVKQYLSTQKSILETWETDYTAMAIVIQQMVHSECSGVVFTADPISGRREVIIEAISGIGEQLVSGTVTPDRYVVNTHGKIAAMLPVKKDQSLLSSEQVLHLAELTNRITGHLGFPQDIEWAWDGQSFVFLQSRPISTLTGKNIYSSKLMADMSPGLLKPLQWSTFTLAMTTQVFGTLFTEIIGPNNFNFKRSIRLIHSRLYANITFFEELLHQLGLPVNFFEMIIRDETERRRRPPMTFRFLYILIFRLIPFILKYGRVSKQMNDFHIKQDLYLKQYRKKNWMEFQIEEKHAHLYKLIQLHSDAQRNIIITGLNMSIRNNLLRKMVRRHAPSVEPSDLLKGLDGLKGLEPSREILRLSGILKTLPEETITLCKEGNSAAIHERLSSLAAGKKLLTEFNAFLQKFGHLSTNTTNFTEKRWIENTDMIWSMIGEGALKEMKPEKTNYESYRIEKKNQVLNQLFFLQKIIFNLLFKTTITYMNLREKISLLLSEDTYQFRRLLLSLGEDLVQKDLINVPEDIFYLYFEELEDILNHFSDAAEIKDTITKRQNRLKADEKIIPDDTICGEQVIPIHRKKVDSVEFLSGICGSSGFKQGYAYVVKDPEEANRTLTSNDILVVPFTHVGWTLLFSNIGGIIAETGGQLSHTSIIAREYGIPAVVDVPRAMQSIQTGQPLTLDADNGRVYLKHIDPLKGD